MKGLIALFAMEATVVVVLLITLAEVMEKLIPLLIVGVCVWGGMIGWRTYQCRTGRSDNRARAQCSRALTVPHYAGPTSVPADATRLASLPPKMQHPERIYVVRGDETGMETLRPDGYPRVSADQLPCARPIQAYRFHATARYSRGCYRPHTPKTRP